MQSVKAVVAEKPCGAEIGIFKPLAHRLTVRMAFVAAMNAAALRAQGVNGADVYTAEGVGDMRVAFYTSLVRGQSATDSMLFVHKALKEGAEREKETEYIRDLWLIAFQARDVRGGKGERTAALNIIKVLLTHFPHHSESVLRLLPEYGCWRDLLVLAGDKSLQAWCLKIIEEQWAKDQVAEKPSLLAKWLPREGSSWGPELVSAVAEVLFHQIRNRRARLATYRRAVSALNARLKTVERNMCGGAWAEIEPSAVPGRCLNLNRKAFLNQKLKGPGPRSDEEDRVACATNFKEHLAAVLAGKAKVNGGSTVYPHQIVRQMLNAGVSEEEMQALEAQWKAIRDKVAVAGRMVPMCDFSGSMSGIPMDVSLALGMLLSEINHPAFKDHILAFDAQPSWIKLDGTARLVDKLKYAQQFAQGLNTNFESAMKLILNRLVEHNVPACEAPDDIVVFTDMGFDAANGRGASGQWSTLITNMKARFRAAGYMMPRLVIWNLRADFKEYHAKADEEGVLMLSGWSPSSMKVLMEGIKVRTPYESMRAVLDDERYDAVRNSLHL